MMVRFIFNLNWFVFSVLTASSKLNKKRSMICDYITASPWWNVILCKILECHRSTSLSWKGLSHTSPWISTQSIQCEVVCQYIILTSSLPLSAGDHNHSKYFIVPCIWDVSATLSNGVLHKRCRLRVHLVIIIERSIENQHSDQRR